MQNNVDVMVFFSLPSSLAAIKEWVCELVRQAAAAAAASLSN